MTSDPRPVHVRWAWILSARRRVGVAVGAGLLVGIVAARFLPWQATVLVGWDVAAVITVAWVYLTASPMSAAVPDFLEGFIECSAPARWS